MEGGHILFIENFFTMAIFLFVGGGVGEHCSDTSNRRMSKLEEFLELVPLKDIFLSIQATLDFHHPPTTHYISSLCCFPDRAKHHLKLPFNLFSCWLFNFLCWNMNSLRAGNLSVVVEISGSYFFLSSL